MENDITGLHHVGLVAADMSSAVETYRRLGFTVSAPTYPVLPSAPGAPPRPVGAANAHIYLRRNFVELVTIVRADESLPAEAELLPLSVPDDKLPGLLTAVRTTAANLSDCLDRFPGMHILIFDSPDIDRATTRLRAADVDHGGVHSIQRPVHTAEGTRMAATRFLEVNSDEPGAAPGRLPEGRLGIAQNSAVDPHRVMHANSAIDLIGGVLCVPDDTWGATVKRYEIYLGRAADRTGRTATFDLGDASVTVVADSAVSDLIPGLRPPALPAFVAYQIAVQDITRTADHLKAAGVSYHRTRTGKLVVPADEALGAAIIFS
ncbi:VOC family protein [Kribbella yunnanensis]|uniref:VOC family protein n=1 Tax=Kribbella yunnanensis TaxID=190194 RepID=UPI0031DF7F6A